MFHFVNVKAVPEMNVISESVILMSFFNPFDHKASFRGGG